jgi:hypothetical protein
VEFSALVGIELDREVGIGRCVVLSIYDTVEPIAPVFDLTLMRLVSLCQPIIIIVECICSPILKEVATLSLSQTRHILLLGVWQLKVPDAEGLVVQMEEGVVADRVTG